MAENSGSRQLGSGKYSKRSGSISRKKAAPYSPTYRGK